MKSRFWRRLPKALATAGAAVLLSVGSAQAQEPTSKDLLDRLDRLEKQNVELKQQVEKLRVAPAGSIVPAAAADLNKEDVQKIVGDYIKAQDEQKKAAEDAKKKDAELNGVVVGSDLKMGVRWNPNNGLTFETPNKDFIAHIGFRFQLDSVWFDQSPALKPASQLGDLQDGVFFRRIRPSFDGTAYEIFEWNCELALEQTQQSLNNMDEVWAGFTKVPVIGSVRIGHNKVPQGFEGDMVSSSKVMTFMERAAYTDAFYENFATGIWIGNNFLDQHLTYSAMWYRQDNELHGNNAADFQDGAYGYSGRVTALPVDENDGRCLVHLGLSGTWRNNEKPDPAAGQGGIVGPRVARFRARPLMRDAVGDFGSGTLTGDSARMVDTGVFASDSTGIIGTEFFSVMGPFSVQAEYAWCFANDAVVGGKNQGTLGFNGGYVQVSYFLTGENRGYDRRLGRLASNYVSSPFTNFWLTRDDGGGMTWGRGAWEVAARYGFLDLNDGVVRGGMMDTLELGVNWYLSNNLKIQFDYTHDTRFDKTSGSNGTTPGWVDGLGMRTQFFF